MNVGIHRLRRRLERKKGRVASPVPRGMIAAAVSAFVINKAGVQVGVIDPDEIIAQPGVREVADVADHEFAVAREKSHVELKNAHDISSVVFVVLGDFRRTQKARLFAGIPEKFESSLGSLIPFQNDSDRFEKIRRSAGVVVSAGSLRSRAAPAADRVQVRAEDENFVRPNRALNSEP